MSENSSLLTKRVNAIRRGKSGAGVKHRTNLSTLSSLHSHSSSSSMKKNKTLSLAMNKQKKSHEKYLIQLGDQQLMQHFSRSGSSLVVRDGDEDKAVPSLTFYHKMQLFCVLMIIPSMVFLFSSNNRMNHSIDPNVHLIRELEDRYGGGGGGGFGERRFDDQRQRYSSERIQKDFINKFLDKNLEENENKISSNEEKNEGMAENGKHSIDVNNENLFEKYSDLMEQNSDKTEEYNEDIQQNNSSNEITSTEPKDETVFNTSAQTPGAVREYIAQGFKVIVLWTPMDGWAYGTGSEAFTDAKCLINKCIFTTNKSYEEESHAIVFNARHIAPTASMPGMRSKHQKWIFFSRDSPQYNRAQDLSPYADRFNWSWTYRSDSDIVFRYGRVVQKNDQNNGFFKLSDVFYNWRKKSKMVLWFADNCHSKSGTDEYVNELRTYIDVDVLSHCFDRDSNDSNANNETLLTQLSQKYLFVIAFEKSYCEDFVSETLYKYLEHSMIPVVHSGMGGTDYSKIVATNSVINANEFTSAKSLADYMLDIGTDFQKYKKYFEWKSTHRISYERQDFCDLCQRLHEHNYRFSLYYDIRNWWFDASKCHR